MSDLEVKKEEKGTLYLKVNGKHPAGKFNLGKHVITNTFKKYVLTDAELKELKTDGPKYWIEIKK